MILEHGGRGDLTCSHEERAKSENLTPAECVGEEEDEDATGEEFDCAEDGGEEEVGRAFGAD